ncbi:hypothetical protein CFC21_009842 [Triticum aestivum]|uniref:Uncharacterized protein n=2 Tax=Triticum aestivum TaxID=4565 RepID=A0A9R1DJ33_WHEAT|nr:myb-related protein P-like [Triticum aestivum]KAF6992888.1 hypothetical protein CFC21_009842 [Triticum aestivum]
MGRAPCCQKLGLKQGKWTMEEDGILANYIAQHGEGSWRSLPKNAGLLRCGKSCRLRWLNYLRDGLRRGNFSKEEDDLIVKLHAIHGNRWSLIASHLPGRTDNEIKNYWNLHLRRQFHSFKQTYTANNSTTITIDINKLSATNRKRRGGQAPGQSPRSGTKKHPVPKPAKPQDGSSPIGATSSASCLPQSNQDQNQPINIIVSRTFGEPYSGNGLCHMVRENIDQNGGVLEPNSAIDWIELWEPNNSMNHIGLLEDESEMEALLSSIDLTTSGHSVIEHGGRSWLEDLLDMDMDWEGFVSHLCGQSAQNDLLQTTTPHEMTGSELSKFEQFVSWLLSDEF